MAKEIEDVHLDNLVKLVKSNPMTIHHRRFNELYYKDEIVELWLEFHHDPKRRRCQVENAEVMYNDSDEPIELNYPQAQTILDAVLDVCNVEVDPDVENEYYESLKE